MRGPLLVLALLATPALAGEVAGVKVDDRVRVESSDLTLNGAGLRTKYFLNIYVAALYLKEKKVTPADVLALPGAKRISMCLMRGLSAKQLTDALEVGIDSNTSAAERETLKGRLDQLTAVMHALQSAKKGDLIALDWLPGMGTRISLNGEPQGKPIAGEDFYRALLRIWLGDEPAQESLKKALLGGS
ncbi:MAG TPA: chalcone isomerase family protein [Burkholderiales bacterium]|nr:chalcone isomerase family protein [Burkholderiales bacterium]HYA46331.1 chalcone isomerase family protein [Burkholderiales bacterium]